jgi:hypothetical protein
MHKFGQFQVGFRYPEHDVTTCVIKNEDGEELGSSTVKRHFRDIPNKRLGRKNALINAIADAALTKAEITVIWKEYGKIGAIAGLPKPKKVKEEPIAQ